MFSQNKVYPRYFFLIEEFVEMFHKAGLILCFHVNDSKPALILRQLGLQSIWQAAAASGVFLSFNVRPSPNAFCVCVSAPAQSIGLLKCKVRKLAG